MKKQINTFFTFIFLLLFIGILNVKAIELERKANFDREWSFHLGSCANAEQPEHDDSQWRVLNLPHDWSIEPAPIQKEGITIGPFSRLNEGGIDTGQTLGGTGWYRKTFTIDENDSDKRFELYFEGIYSQAEVWVNGKKAYYNAYGYTSFKFDITEYCNPAGEPNTIAVKAINVGQNSRWYAGSGIYRHVWLIKTDKLHLDEWDTYVDASKLEKNNAHVNISTIIHNQLNKNQDGSLDIDIYSPNGEKVYSESTPINIPAKQNMPIEMSLNLKKPLLWSLEAPQLYSAELTIKSSNSHGDKLTIPFGIRTIEFNAKEGFLLNGKSVKLKGGCLHHDNGLLGAMAIDRAEERKVELMLANGYNAVRCAHNPPSESFLNACDRLGMLVIDEAFDQWQRPKRPQDYHQFFDEWSYTDLTTMVRRDRNHPSIIMWSIGNEIAERASDEGEKIAKRLVSAVEEFDESRFTTVGANAFWDNRHLDWDASERAFRNVDIAGYNYMWHEYENDHKKHPERVMYGSETVPKESAQNWNLIDKNPYIIGDFVWTVIDYLGEAGLAHTLELADGEHSPQFMGWPWYNAWCGDIDLCGNKKPQSYYRDILWHERDIYITAQQPVTKGKREDVNYWGWKNELLSWNWPGLEGETMTVRVYSRAHKVKLYLDNQLIGEKETSKEFYEAAFNVPYKAGVLKAVGIDKRNKEIHSTQLSTTGKPVAIRLNVDRDHIKANKDDLAYVKIEIIDIDGNIVPDATTKINIEQTGAGRIIASGNGGYKDMESFHSLTPNAFRGVAIAIVQPDEEAGEIKIAVTANGLKGASTIIEISR